jgi:hypothetical protein
MAATDKSLAQSDKSRTPVPATNRQATARRFTAVDARRSRQGPILRGLSAAASFHSIRNHIGLPAAVVLAALGAAVAVASAVTDRR